MYGGRFGRHLEYRGLPNCNSRVLICFLKYTIWGVKINQKPHWVLSCKVGKIYAILHPDYFALPLFRNFTVWYFRTSVISYFHCFAVSYFRSFTVSYFRCFVLALFCTSVVSYFRSLVLSLFRTFVVSQFSRPTFLVMYFPCFIVMDGSVSLFRFGVKEGSANHFTRALAWWPVALTFFTRAPTLWSAAITFSTLFQCDGQQR